MNRESVLPFCHKRGIYFHRQSCNVIRASPTETDVHFKAKAMLGWELMKKGQTIFTEYPVFKAGKKIGEIDLLWLDELKAFEFENNYTKERIQFKNEQFGKRFDVWVIDLAPWHKDFDASLKDLLERTGVWKDAIVAR